MEYIIVQAGGKGTRLGHLTENKPKALVPVENLPMIFHLFRKFPDKQYIIIADYKKDVLREYLSCFAEVNYQVVVASGGGTCGGVRQAIDLLPEDTPLLLTWSDLILPDNFELPATPGNYIGISQTFPCRWSYMNRVFTEKSSEEHGVAGFFVFEEKAVIKDVPTSGELVRWMHESGFTFTELGLAGTREFGLLSEYEALEKEKCRPFNKMTIEGDTFTKEPVDRQGIELARLERKWYEFAISKDIKNIPKLLSTDPLKMERINGGNIYEYANASVDEKRDILDKIVHALKNLHNIESVHVDRSSVKEAYFTKTIDRLAKIQNLIPQADNKTIIINGKECRNIYFYKDELEQKLDVLKCDYFTFIHGDCTFSNMMLKNDSEPVFIDPRGYFGHTELYGDPNYDWAKLYYSIVGNYDRFNLKDFRLSIDEKDINLKIESNRWESLEQDFFTMSGADPYTIKLLHAVIWLSLTTYAWHDYDSICGAFYNGLYHLEEVL